MTAALASSLVDVGHAAVALDGVDSGDLHVVAPFPAGVLVAVIDGLGHGPEARDAARAAAEVLLAHPAEPVVALVQRCHEALRRTRGVVMSLASLGPVGELIWTGVGNVEGVLVRGDRTARDTIQLRGGVVGYQLPPLRATTHPIARGDTLIMVTDGVHAGFLVGLALERSPQELARAILDRHGRGNDDALAVVARYQGGVG